MTAPHNRCPCTACFGRALRAARRHLRRGNLAVADGILTLIIEHETPPEGAPCMGQHDPWARVHLLEQQVRHYRGFACAYADQEQQRLALGPKCACLSGARQ
jgi:hypothetical protein